MSATSKRMTDLRLFSGEKQYENFSRFKEILPVVRMAPARSPHPFDTGRAVELPSEYFHDGRMASSKQFLLDTDTAALLVLHAGVIRYEQYWLTGGEKVQWISWSVAKSFVSALVGIAIDEGHIGSIDEPISDYIRVNPGSAYEGVSIKAVLQMSSGARWNEDYNDPASDIYRLGAAMAGVSTLDDFVASMAPEAPAGTICRYNSGDTQALGTLLVRATGRSLADYMWEKLCDPLGFESESYWLIDETGTEMAFAGLNLTARDFAKFGELYRRNGRWGERQIVPSAWVEASVTSDLPHLQPGGPILADHALDMGYGYQWWLPAGTRREFSAMGIYNQLVYVDPSRQLVIVKLSANPAYGTSMDELTNREFENVAFLRAIGETFD